MHTHPDVRAKDPESFLISSTIVTSTCSLLLLGADRAQAQVDFDWPVYLDGSEFRSFSFDGDFDEDGRPDAVIGSADAGLEILRNNGDGTFSSYSDIGRTGVSGYNPVIRDMDGDGDDDIVWESDAAIRIAFNMGKGTSWRHTEIATDRFDEIEVGDIDRDGDLDVLVMSELAVSTHEVIDGEIQAGTVILDRSTDDYDLFSLEVGRFDADGDVDVAVLAVDWGAYVNYVDDYFKCYGAEVVLLTNSGQGQFAVESITTLPYQNSIRMLPRTLKVADLDGDFDLDWAILVGSTDFYEQEIPAEVRIVENVGGSFVLSVQPWQVGHGDALAFDLGDIDSDGRIDAIVATFEESAAYVMKGQGDLTFDTVTPFPTGLRRTYVLVNRDVTGDGQLDLIGSDRDGAAILPNITPLDNPHLEATPLIRGERTTFTVTGLRPNEGVHVAFTQHGWRPTLGLEAYGQITFDLRGPILETVYFQADEQGAAVYDTLIPNFAPTGPIHMQGAIRRGAAGEHSVKTPFVSSVIQ